MSELAATVVYCRGAPHRRRLEQWREAAPAAAQVDPVGEAGAPAGVEVQVVGGDVDREQVEVAVAVEVADAGEVAHGVPVGADLDASAEGGPGATRVEVQDAVRDLAGKEVDVAVTVEVADHGQRVHGVHAGAARLSQPDPGSHARVEVEGGVGGLHGDEIWESVVVEVSDRGDLPHDVPAGTDADAGAQAGAGPPVEPQVAVGRLPGHDVLVPVTVEVAQAGQ